MHCLLNLGSHMLYLDCMLLNKANAALARRSVFINLCRTLWCLGSANLERRITKSCAFESRASSGTTLSYILLRIGKKGWRHFGQCRFLGDFEQLILSFIWLLTITLKRHLGVASAYNHYLSGYSPDNLNYSTHNSKILYLQKQTAHHLLHYASNTCPH